MSLLVPLCIVGVAAVLFFPGLMYAYWRLVIPQRLDDIRSNIWNQEAIATYVGIFTNPTVEDRAQPEEWRGKRGLLSFMVRWSEVVRSSWKYFVHLLFGTRSHTKGKPGEEGLDGILIRDFGVVHSEGKYLASVPPVTLVVGAVVWTCCAWAWAKVADPQSSIARLDDAVILALAGAYVWSVFEILSRYRSRDLTPEDLLEMNLRCLAAVPIGYAFSLVVMDEVAASMAFVSAAFPFRDLRLLLRRRALQKLGQDRLSESNASDGSLSRLVDGLGDPTLARLEELQIVTYMDLAYVNPVRLMARTGYSLRHILAWIDQALLAVYASQHKAKLSKLGIPCALDACEFYRDHCYDTKTRKERSWRTDPTVVELAKELTIPVEFVFEILSRIHADPHVRFLRKVWYSKHPHKARSEAETAQGPPASR